MVDLGQAQEYFIGHVGDGNYHLFLYLGVDDEDGWRLERVLEGITVKALAVMAGDEGAARLDWASEPRQGTTGVAKANALSPRERWFFRRPTSTGPPRNSRRTNLL